MTIQGGEKKKLNDCQKAKCVKGQLEFYAGVYNALLFNKKKEVLYDSSSRITGDMSYP